MSVAGASTLSVAKTPSAPTALRHQGSAEVSDLSTLDKRLLDEFQRDFPLCSRPFEAIAQRLRCDEATVIHRLGELERLGYVSRVGPVFRPNCLGASTLAAMAVPREQLQQVAELVSSYPQVNHNYEREHHFNLWFVVIAPDEQALAELLDDISRRSGLAVMDLPLTEAFHIDLGFRLWQS